MTTKSINKSLFKIGLPIFAGFLISQIQRITDQAFLGNVSAEYLSAVGNAGFTIWTSISLLFALGTGTAIIVSQKIGEGNKKEAEVIVGTTFVFSSFFSTTIFFAWFFGSEFVYKLMGLTDPILGYAVIYTRIYIFGILILGINSAAQAVFHGTGITRPVLISSILRGGINIILDWLLIFGNLGCPELGIEGAALATLVADIIGGGYFIIAAFSPKLPVKLTIGAIKRASLKKYISVIKIGLPTGLEELLWNIGNILLVRFLNAVNPLAAGIYTIIMTITCFPTFFFLSMGNASMTLSGRKTGEGRPEEIKIIGQKAMMICSIVSIAFAIIYIAFPEFIVRLFSKDAAVIEQTGKMLLISSFALLPKAANFIYGGGIRGMGDTKWMLFTQIFGTIFVLIVAKILIFNFNLAILGLFIAVLFDEMARGIMNGIKFYLKIRTNMLKLKLIQEEAV